MGAATSAGYSAAGADEALALRHGPPAAVRAALLAARSRTLQLAEDFLAALGPSLLVPYAAELNPPLWELGHIGWFQEWWLSRNPQRALGVRADPRVPRPPSLLPPADAWYDSSRVAHPSRWELPLPDAEATLAYLARTQAATLELLDALPAAADDAALYFFRLAALHEQMHAEAAVYMADSLGLPLRERSEAPAAAAAGELELGATRFMLGSAADGFAFDNELGAQQVELPAFGIDAAPVTWAAFLPFLEDGGYTEPRWWSSQGRAWLAGQQQRHPAGLRRTDAGWEQGLGGRWHALDPARVVRHVSAFEAEAWCRWAGRRLPSEAEWECAALAHPDFRWGQCWEWTASRFEPYPGFAPHPYRDYSMPWFGSRRVLRGASAATAPALAHARYRNFFEPQRRDIFAGFRSARMQDTAKRSAI
jgi:ergothioneine biosynthesis protein EgtB